MSVNGISLESQVTIGEAMSMMAHKKHHHKKKKHNKHHKDNESTALLTQSYESTNLSTNIGYDAKEIEQKAQQGLESLEKDDAAIMDMYQFSKEMSQVKTPEEIAMEEENKKRKDYYEQMDRLQKEKKIKD